MTEQRDLRGFLGRKVRLEVPAPQARKDLRAFKDRRESDLPVRPDQRAPRVWLEQRGLRVQRVPRDRRGPRVRAFRQAP